MKLHRFYIPPETELTHRLWLQGKQLFHQWKHVLRLREGESVGLFDGVMTDRLYKILEYGTDAIHLELVTEFVRNVPANDVTLLWALLKRDNNDWVFQKGTELGVSHFVPLLTDRAEKKSLNVERAQKIVIEAAEQCGRSDIPTVREEIPLHDAIEEYVKEHSDVQLFLCDEAVPGEIACDPQKPMVVCIGPEGGWSDAERAMLQSVGARPLHLGAFTLRAETAVVSALTLVMQQK